MKKFLTLLSAAFIAVASLATVASAAPIAEDTFKPTIALDITKTVSGRAVITATADLSKELDLRNDGDAETWIATGFGLTGWQVDLDLNTDIFTDASKSIAGSYLGAFANAKVSTDGVVTIGTATIKLTDAYKTMSVEDLNKLAFADVTYAELIVTEWNEGFEAAEMVSETKWRSDSAGDYPIDLSVTRVGVGADIEEPTWTAADASWAAPAGKKAIWWGFKFEDGSFGGHQFITVTDGAEVPTTKTVGIGAAEDFDIDGDVEFAVAVILDEATDAAKFDAYVGR